MLTPGEMCELVALLEQLEKRFNLDELALIGRKDKKLVIGAGRTKDGKTVVAGLVKSIVNAFEEVKHKSDLFG